MSADLVDALLGAGLRLAGPLGRTHDGFRWSVLDDEGRRWAMTLSGSPAPMDVDPVRQRVAALAEIEHPHLACTGPVLDLGRHGLVVLQEEVDGADLATLRAARGPWSPGEVVTVVVPLAQALAALHDVGLVHGDVAPANVVVSGGGLPVLVDLVHGAEPTEIGTPGYAAPERAGGASPASDVHALARVGLALAGRGDGDRQHDRLVACLSRAAAPDPAVRPTAAELAQQVYRSCDPEPVVLPEAAVLARHALQRLADDRDMGTRRVDGGSGRRRARHRRPSRVPRVAIPVVAVVLAAAAVLLFGGVPEDVAATAGAAGHRPGPADPVVAAIRLTSIRANALAEQDARELGSATVPGSPAARADAESLARVGAAVDGDLTARVRVDGARLCGPGPDEPALPGRVECPLCPRVLVRARAYGVPEPDVVADEVGAAGGGPVDDVVLVLDRFGGGWRVSAVEPACP